MLGATLGVPYLASQSGSGGKLADNAAPPVNSGRPMEPVWAPSMTPAPVAQPPLQANPAPAQSIRFQSVAQFLRFDVTKEWVYRNWDRKSTGPTDVGLFGVRVPLVMGTQPTALAGSLTYFFNTYGQVEHISFRGRTGDTTELVNFLVRTYEFERAAGLAGEQAYRVTRRGRVQSELRTRPEPVVDSSSPHGSIAVELELARPGTRRFLPPRGPQLQIPQVAEPPAAATAESTGSGAAAKSGVDSYLDGIRYATPRERDQVLWKRWPN